MNLFFASDLHGSLSATDLVLDNFERSDAQWLILLGDLLYHGCRNALPDTYAPKQVALRLNEYASQIIAVQGNCDSEVDQTVLSFPIMTPWQQILLPERRLFLTHGHHYRPDNLPFLRTKDVFVYGHTHIPQAEKCGDIYCFNPGSASLPKGDYPASFGLLSYGGLQVLTLTEANTLINIDF